MNKEQNVKYDDIFGNIVQQKNITVMFVELIEARERVLDIMSISAMEPILDPVHALPRAVQQR